MPGNIHDTLFKTTFSQAEHAEGILRAVLPASLVARIDFSTLELCPGSFVDEELSERHTDLLFSVKLSGHRAHLYILYEHQSSVVALMAFRLLVYMVRIWEAYLKESPGAKRIPAILPVVLHHSAAGWTADVTFEALLDVDADALSELGDLVPRFRFVLDDISHESDEHLRNRAMTALGRLVLWCLRTARTPDELLTGMGRWVDLVWEVRRAPSGMGALATVWRYILTVTERFRPDEVVAQLVRAIGKDRTEELVTVADQLREEGLQRGRQEVLLVQLAERFGALPERVVAQVRAASAAQLNVWVRRVLSGPTLADVLEGEGVAAE